MNKAQVSLMFLLLIELSWRGATAVPMQEKMCPSSCVADYRPVCGTDGRTYPNDCVLRSTSCQNAEAKEVTVSHDGPCVESTKPSDPCPQTVCLEVYQPVCGSDGKTYPNKCQLHASNCKNSDVKEVTISHDGPCKEIQPKRPTDPCMKIVCLQVYDPVCGSDGKTYPNTCRLDAFNCGRPADKMVTMAHLGECPVKTPNARCSGNLPCPLGYRPVCGSDGNTYDNECWLHTTNCNKSASDQIFIVSTSTCESHLA
ncbi:four-domain proteases inhibitor-like [Physella acuta]|uniref:four-domain proteases inhibitor-like n=1 Tax=Physella acuta TaxID=109671 RepID=UPI0027DB0777|nr:four-domain proteases inhibitor-like [Physella acuta]